VEFERGNNALCGRLGNPVLDSRDIPNGRCSERPGSRQIHIEQLRDENFVVSPPGATIRTATLRAAQNAGFEPRIMFESREVTRIRAIVAAGPGIGACLARIGGPLAPKVASVELIGADFSHTLSLCWRERRRHSQAARALLDHADRALGQQHSPGYPSLQQGRYLRRCRWVSALVRSERRGRSEVNAGDAEQSNKSLPPHTSAISSCPRTYLTQRSIS
jgi:hypothetical protein